MTTTQTPEASKCQSCRIDEKRQAGVEITNAERNHWMLWGCTCEPQAAAETIAFINRVTR